VNPITGSYDYWHPSRSVQSMMSYGWMYALSAPTILDYAMLADSGYAIAGINAPLPTAATTPTTATQPVVTQPVQTTPVVATVIA
ncbi:MAG: hypothetical protein IGS48_08565, partial [Oscillatoriales cyanobacterium C42_A2020_001]|nr:hypothetical protein [Leptolyngbyaceae cyanobacterium C42_A2020_001]